MMTHPKIGSVGPDGELVTGIAPPLRSPGQVITEPGPDGKPLERWVTTAETLGRVGVRPDQTGTVPEDAPATQDIAQEVIESPTPHQE